MSKDYGYPSFELICKASSGDEISASINLVPVK